jgi:DNA-binding transcriptional regulator/RsmH inhibitor MraZ
LSPAAADVPEEFTDEFKTRIFQDIRNELEKGAPQEWLRPVSQTRDLLESSNDEESLQNMMFRARRKFDSLLKEFGW